jgi:hypothetical protein
MFQMTFSVCFLFVASVTLRLASGEDETETDSDAGELGEHTQLLEWVAYSLWQLQVCASRAIILDSESYSHAK